LSETGFFQLPRDGAVVYAQQDEWRHEPGCEYLAANPIRIPSLAELISTTEMDYSIWNISPFSPGCIIAGMTDQAGTPSSTDPFLRLPQELKDMVINELSSKELASLRLASRAFYEVQTFLFRRFVLEDLPWLWEANDIPRNHTDWHQLYVNAKLYWSTLKGLQNRKRIWKDIEWIVKRMGPFREVKQ